VLTIGSKQTGGRMGLGGRLAATLFLGFFLGMGLLFCGLIIRESSRHISARAWPQADCEVLASRVVEDASSRDRSDRYEPQVEFAYQHGRERLTSQRLFRAPKRYSDYGEAQAWVDKYPTGARARCRVNPADPAEAILEVEFPWMLPFLLIPLMFVAIGGLGIYSVWRSAGKEAQETAAPLSSRALKPGARWVAVAFFGAFLAFGLVFTWFFLIRPLAQVVAARQWIATPCTVVSSDVRSHRGDKGTTYSVDILYRFEFGGREYRANRYSFLSGSSSGRSGKEAIVRRYPAGGSALCFVNPAQPSQAVLNRNFTGLMWLGLIPLVFVVIGAGGMMGVLRRQTGPAGTRAAVVPSPGAVQASGAVVLQAAASPLTKLIGGILVSLFWNGIVSVFVWQCVKGWQRGRPEWFLMLFLIPFVLIGLAMIGYVIYTFLCLFNPRPQLTVNATAVPLGGVLDVQWRFRGSVSRLNRLRLVLEGQEEATYRRGTTTTTDRETFAQIELANVTNRPEMAAGRARVTLPRDTMHTFTAAHNKITWKLRLAGEIERWPDVNEEFPITLLPAPVAGGGPA
jgi:hypothetical protein